jgi:hypothetical protein
MFEEIGVIAEDPVELRNQGMVVRQRLNLELTDRPRDLCRIEFHRVLLLLEVAAAVSPHAAHAGTLPIERRPVEFSPRQNGRLPGCWCNAAHPSSVQF